MPFNVHASASNLGIAAISVRRDTAAEALQAAREFRSRGLPFVTIKDLFGNVVREADLAREAGST